MTTLPLMIGRLPLLLCSMLSLLIALQVVAEEAATFLIIAPSQFKPALATFVAQKKTSMTTRLCELETVLKSGTGCDDPEKLKRFLYQEWQKGSLRYVLLVGDVDIFPVRFMVLDRVTPAAQDYAFYPSDLYYADLAKDDGSFDDWNAQKEGFHGRFFGEVRGEKNKKEPINYDQVHYAPEIAVGRWPVSTAAEVELVAAKSITYEMNLAKEKAGAKRKAAFVAVGGWVDSRSLMNSLATRLAPGWDIQRLLYRDPGAAAESPATLGSEPRLLPTHTEVCRLLNEGARLVVHAGHGQSDLWEQCFSVRDLDKVTNAANPAVMISAGCSTAYFSTLPPYQGYVDENGAEHKGTDNGEVFTEPPPPPACYQKDRFNPTGLGEQVLKRGPGGAVVYIGCNTGSQPCGLSLVEGFIDTLSRENASNQRPSVGDCWKGAVKFYFERERLSQLKPDDGWYPPSIFFQGMKFMFFGDPTLKL